MVSGLQIISLLTTKNTPSPMSHVGLSLLRAGPVAAFHLTALFLPVLLLPEGWLPEAVKNNSNRPLIHSFPFSFCSSQLPRPQGVLQSRCHMRIKNFLEEMVRNSRSVLSYRLLQDLGSPLGLQRPSVQQAWVYPQAGYSSSSL